MTPLMKASLTLKNNSDTIEIHFFGSVEGESIVIRMPQDNYGVIDCFNKSFPSKDGNETLNFLKSRNVKSLEFLAITHFHYDHVMGISQLIEHFQEIKYIWRPAAMNGAQLRSLVSSEELVARIHGSTKASRLAAELRKIFSLIGERVRSEKTMLDHAKLSLPLYPKKAGKNDNTDVTITCIAPSSSEINAFEKCLANCFDSEQKMLQKIPSELHNRTSLGLLIKSKNTRLILGGDVEKANWKEAHKEYKDDMDVDFVKISHHGSRNGYCVGLWEAFSKSSKPTSVFSVYSSRKLPKQVALDHIRDYTSGIFTPSKSALAEITPPLKGLESLWALRAKMDVKAKRDVKTYRVSFTFDNDGQLVSEDLGEDGVDYNQLNPAPTSDE